MFGWLARLQMLVESLRPPLKPSVQFICRIWKVLAAQSFIMWNSSDKRWIVMKYVTFMMRLHRRSPNCLTLGLAKTNFNFAHDRRMKNSLQVRLSSMTNGVFMRVLQINLFCHEIPFLNFSSLTLKVSGSCWTVKSIIDPNIQHASFLKLYNLIGNHASLFFCS